MSLYFGEVVNGKLFDQNNAVFANLSVNVSVNMLKTNHRLINAFTGILALPLCCGGGEENLLNTLHGYCEMSG